MVKFFRRIRQRLMNEGNMKRYLIYSIGEILLVMIGILLAIQVNNWNENRKNNKLKINYLKRLQSDLTKDSISINTQFKILNLKAIILTTIQKGELDSVEYFVSKKYTRGIFVTRSIYPAHINTTTFDDLLSTGNIGILKNLELRESIIDYYNLAKRQEKILNNNLSNWANVVSKLIPGEMGMNARSGQKKPTQSQIKTLKENLRLNLEEIKPVINGELNHTGLQYTYNKRSEESCNKLLEMVKEDLNEYYENK